MDPFQYFDRLKSKRGKTETRQYETRASQNDDDDAAMDRPAGPIDTQMADRQPPERQPDDRRPVDRQPVDRQMGDRRPPERQPVDRQMADMRPFQRQVEARSGRQVSFQPVNGGQQQPPSPPIGSVPPPSSYDDPNIDTGSGAVCLTNPYFAKIMITYEIIKTYIMNNWQFLLTIAVCLLIVWISNPIKRAYLCTNRFLGLGGGSTGAPTKTSDGDSDSDGTVSVEKCPRTRTRTRTRTRARAVRAKTARSTREDPRSGRKCVAYVRADSVRGKGTDKVVNIKSQLCGDGR